MNIRELLRLAPQEGEVGIEIEVEGENIHPPMNKYWRGEHDGSLRGNCLEYVLRHPVSRDEVNDTLCTLQRLWTENNTVIKESNRAGVHVHINVQEESLNTLGAFICLYYSFESLLMKFCGKEREGNLFCLRVKDAENVIDTLLSILRQKYLRGLRTDKIRYASLNLKAIAQYGSLEFRGMRSTSDLSLIELWAKLLLCIKDAAKRYGKPAEIPYQLSSMGAEGLIRDVFGEYADLFLGMHDYEQLIFEDTRRVQQVSFSPEWQKYEDYAIKRIAERGDEEEGYRLRPKNLIENYEIGIAPVPVPIEPIKIR